jgi:thiamine pyrophosphokinase
VSGLVVVVAGGEPVEPADVADLPAGVPVVAADSGVDLALDLRLRVTHAVGDFDSISAAGLFSVGATGAEVERHPAEKDQTDLDLALRVAVGLGARRIVVVGGGGGRLDHLLGNALLMASDRFAAVPIEARPGGGARLHVVRRTVGLAGGPGDLVSLLAVGGPATGVTTDGLRYPLLGANLDPGSSLGVSNELTGARASVSVASGALLVVQPGGTD